MHVAQIWIFHLLVLTTDQCDVLNLVDLLPLFALYLQPRRIPQSNRAKSHASRIPVVV